MRRRAPFIVPAILATALVAALAGTAQAQTFVTITNLGRVVEQFAAGDAAWLSSATTQYGDTNGNGIADSERGRCAVLEQEGLTRVRITSCRLQQKIDTNGNGAPDTWVTKLANEVDRVDDSYAVTFSGHARMCFSGLTWPTRTRTGEAVRRESDGSVFYRATYSSEVQARAFASDPACA